MRLLVNIKEGRKWIKDVDELKLKGKKSLIAVLWSLVVAIIVAAPFALLYISLLTIYSYITITYWILMILGIVLAAIINGLSMGSYYKLLQYSYPEDELIQAINIKCIFWSEVFNPIMLIMFIAAVTAVNVIII